MAPRGVPDGLPEHAEAGDKPVWLFSVSPIGDLEFLSSLRHLSVAEDAR
jgi:hypothetical protein